MSVEINWETLTGGDDGARLAETVRAFIHDRFQKVTLPKFIRSVQVHSFDFGSIAPDVEIKDVCDPLPDFYEDEDDDGRSADGDNVDPATAPPQRSMANQQKPPRQARPTIDVMQRPSADARPRMPASESPKQPMSPAIPGGTTNFSYFHLPLNPGLSGHAMHRGSVTPHFGTNWPLTNPAMNGPLRNSVSQEEPIETLPEEQQSIGDDVSATAEPAANDVQIVSHLRYSGNVRLSLTADILLDYPTTSFVGIPLQLNVTGLTFDGVAILAYIKRKTHFCFLAPDDADALVGGEESGLDDSSDEDVGKDSPSPSPARPRAGAQPHPSTEETPRKPVGGLFEEIHVESEIGQKAGGKQVLKNVGKVEKFVLEQVRKIFENEFVYPSFWTFLV